MHPRIRFTVPIALMALAGACTFVKMAPGGAQVQVARADRDLSACQRRGEIEGTVKDRVGPYSREPVYQPVNDYSVSTWAATQVTRLPT